MTMAAAFVCAILVTGTAASASEYCDHEYHEIYWEDPTCYSVGMVTERCDYCGDEKTTYGTHYADHAWEFYYWVSQPNCVDDGEAVWKCAFCDTTKNEITPSKPNDHMWSGWYEIEPASCIKQGIREHECSICTTTEQEIIPYSDHSYGSWVTLKTATCQEEGLRKKTCEVCGSEKKESTGYADHQYEKWEIVTEPTDSSCGEKRAKCAVCKKDVTEEILPEGTIEIGSRKEISVYVLQSLLTEEEILNDKIDGIYGGKTEAAVREFQRRNGFEETGTAYPQTISRLMSDLAERMEEEEADLEGDISVRIVKQKDEIGFFFKKDSESYSWVIETEEEERETETAAPEPKKEIRKADTEEDDTSNDGAKILKSFFDKLG